ncbi:MAG: UMP kinase [Rhodospirillales bacterium]|jgi:uridylate kinase|nr:UMP kinase [Rhodospirillales bacterium]
MDREPKYRRVLLKLSGEALMGGRDFGLDIATVNRICDDVRAVHRMGVELCLVVGGGNIFRGISAAGSGFDRTTGDNMGMLATVINALAIQSIIEGGGIQSRVLSAIPMATICEPYIRRRAVRHLEKGRIVIFAAGTGNPFFTTDTAAALRAAEIDCDVLMKGTLVDGVYDADPRKVADAKRYDTLTYNDVLSKELGVIDAAAVALARDNKVPILVFSIQNPGAFADVVTGCGRSTIICEGS